MNQTPESRPLAHLVYMLPHDVQQAQCTELMGEGNDLSPADVGPRVPFDFCFCLLQHRQVRRTYQGVLPTRKVPVKEAVAPKLG